VNFYRKLRLIPNRKSHFQIVVSDNKTRFTTQFNPHDTFQETKAKLRTIPTPKDESLLQKIALKKSQGCV